MAPTTLPPAPDQRASAGAVRAAPRAVLATCMVLAPLVILLGFIVDPTFGVPQGAGAIFAAFRAASPQQIGWFLFFNAVTPYVFPLSYLGLGWLAWPRAPGLAMAGTACGLAGALPWPLFVQAIAQAAAFVQVGDSATFATIWNRVSGETAVAFLQYSWAVGHLLGYLILGVALARAHAIPRWAAALFVAGVPLQMVAYPTHQGLWQILGFALVGAGSIPAAGALLHGSSPAERFAGARSIR